MHPESGSHGKIPIEPPPLPPAELSTPATIDQITQNLSAEDTAAILYADRRAEQLHAGQKRKGTEEDYITHPRKVALIVSFFTKDRDTIIAALLHDVLEDVPKYTEEMMRQEFGDNVVQIVKAVSILKSNIPSADTPATDPKVRWQAQKDAYLAQLAALTDQAPLIVSAADKIHNMKSSIVEYGQHGEDFWQIFKTGKAGRLWFYTEIVRILSKKLEDKRLVHELHQTFAEYQLATNSHPAVA